MSMPKAAVNEDNCAMPRQDDVWPARKSRTAQPVSKSTGVEALANSEFDCRVFSTDSRHQFGTPLLADDVQDLCDFLPRLMLRGLGGE